MPESLLNVRDLSIHFGGLKAVSDVSFSVEEKSITALIGPNGAGKTTVFNLLTGVYPPSSGEIFFQNKSLLGLRPHEIAKKGISRTFQNIRLFKELSVFDNVLVGCDVHNHFGLGSSLFDFFSYRRQENEHQRFSSELLKIFDLADRKNSIAKNLPYGAQRRLEVARAMAMRPQVLLLDEPAAGMNPQETVELMNRIRFVRDHFGVAILLIEHDMKLVMNISEKVIVLDHGQKIAEGNPFEVRQNPLVIEAYLGHL